MITTTIFVFAKPPRPGACKTRLAATIGDRRASALAAAFLLDVWDVVRARPFARAVLAATELDHEAYGMPRDVVMVSQGEGDLGDRMARMLRLGLSETRFAIVVGADCPGIGARCFEDATRVLLSHDAYIAPTDDGGFYLLAVRTCPEGIFDGVPWSAPTTCRATIARMRAIGLSVFVGPPFTDVDDSASLAVLRQRLVSEYGIAANAPRTHGLLAALDREDTHDG
jgi:uncharacterized protein